MTSRLIKQSVSIISNDNDVADFNSSKTTFNISSCDSFVLTEQVSATRKSRVPVVHDTEAHLVHPVIVLCECVTHAEKGYPYIDKPHIDKLISIYK